MRLILALFCLGTLFGCIHAHPSQSPNSVLAASSSTELYVKEYGDPTRPAIVFIHGGPGYNSYGFEKSTAAALADQGFFVVVYDQLGSGRSPKGSPSDYTYPRFVADLHKIINDRHLVKPILLGHSFGGSIALQYLATYEQETGAVVLIDAPLSYPEMLYVMLQNCQSSYQNVGDLGNLGYVNYLLSRMFPAPGLYNFELQNVAFTFQHGINCGLYNAKRPAPESAAIMQELTSGPEAYLLENSAQEPFAGFTTNEGYVYRDFSPIAHAHRSKIFGIYGGEDGLFNPISLAEIANTLHPDHFAVIPGASHNSFQDQPNIFMATLLRWVRWVSVTVQ